MSSDEKWAVGAFVFIFVVAAILATLSARNHWVLWLAVSGGALGGWAHELAQSGGKILYPKSMSDGFYLGGLSGVVLGAVAGILVVRGHLTGGTSDINMVQLSYEVFMAGLALKGITEAASGKSVP